MKLVLIKFIVIIFTASILNSCDSSVEKVHQKQESKKMWSGIPGDPNIGISDRMAIKDVMNAYAFYWDNSDLENFFGLFTDEAAKNISKEKTAQRFDYFKSNELQRRHLMANTHFLEQNDSTAYIKQYALLTSTKNKKELNPISTIVYDVWLIKVDGIWKISKHNTNLDGKIDMPFNPK